MTSQENSRLLGGNADAGALRKLLCIVPLLALMVVGVCGSLSAAPPATVDSPASPGGLAVTAAAPGQPGGHAARPAESRLPLIAGYCTLIVAASLAGGWLPGAVELSHNRMQVLVSCVGGLMLGIAVFHLLPHSIEQTGSPHLSARWVMGGLLTMFFLVRLFHFHNHGEAVQHDFQRSCGETTPVAGAAAGSAPASSGHGHSHSHSHAGHSHSAPGGAHRLSWAGVAIGLALHTLIDGLALGASVESAVAGTGGSGLPGLGTFLAILLHKPLDAVSITSLMISGGWSARSRNFVNAGFALMCPLGAVLFSLGVRELSTSQHLVVGAALAFSAGVFLCISLGDLLPELELHSHNRLKLTLALLAGILVAWMVEQTHTHPHPHQPGAAAPTASVPPVR